jgi:4-hydroxybenzoate polyprenyltransferase
VVAVAAIAGADLARIALLASSMLCLQLGIGAANDWADAAADATARPTKPIPAGLVRRPVAAAIAVGAGAVGLVLAALAGLPPLVVACVGLATGLAYDLHLKRTRWSWLPFAVGIPLLPVFAWVGATGTLPVAFAVLVPIAMIAGAALAVANAVADVEADRSAGTTTVATSLGLARARVIGMVLQGLAVVTALASAALLGGDPAWVAVAAAGSIAVLVGLMLGWSDRSTTRRHGWEVQAMGLAMVATGWLGAVAAAGLPAG